MSPLIFQEGRTGQQCKRGQNLHDKKKSSNEGNSWHKEYEENKGIKTGFRKVHLKKNLESQQKGRQKEKKPQKEMARIWFTGPRY